MMMILTTGVVAALLAATLFLLYRSRGDAERLREKYSGIIDLAEAQDRARTDLEKLRQEQQAANAEHERRRTVLETQYTSALAQYESLRKSIALLEENLEDISFGLYKPHFNLASSEEYKFRIEDIRTRQKDMVRAGTAARSAKSWHVGGSEKDGARMTKQYLKLLLRAFNAECDATIAIVSWANVTKMEARIQKSYEATNALGQAMEMSIAPDYRDLKMAELRLAYEYEQKKYEEREEQRRLREQIREEERVQRELERAREEAEREEVQFGRALEKARAEAARATGEELMALAVRIQGLEAQLEEAHRQKQRVISQAQLTKAGHVYVVSNVGAFGERVFKIGMTRRLEPLERIAELGDASVPFPFDIHAMIYSEGARDLESELHAFFATHRTNLVNLRKEFFSVSLDEIEQFARQKGHTIEFTKIAEAREYRETVSLRQVRQRPDPASAPSGFPQQLFQSSAEAVAAAS